MTILLTGAAGFIGYHVAEALLGRGETVLGVDSVNAYYDPALKEARLARLQQRPGFRFARLDIADAAALAALVEAAGGVDRVVHLAAQAGVRHSLKQPQAYIDANITGHLAILELCRHRPGLRHLVYASSSSVYGGNAKLPWSVEDPVERPLSLYGATKRADELMSYSYAHLFGLPSTGLRFFTVYGPWGRPDMALFIFTRAVLAGQPLTLFNQGEMKRDFTYVDDIVAGVVAALDHPPPAAPNAPPHRVYNLGNHRSEPLRRLVELVERECGRKAIVELAPMQPGDVRESFADIAASTRDLGFLPRVSIDEGVPRFVRWYREYYGV
ncbi:MAG: SDR family NAD(P)-dependent oxidoreductase [Dongiaceae bacterium]